MCRFRGDGGKENRAVLGRQRNPRRKDKVTRLSHEPDGLEEAFQALLPSERLEVDSRLPRRVARREQLHILQFPEPQQNRVRPVSRGKKDVRVQEETVQPLPLGPPVRNLPGIYPETADFFEGPGVVPRVHRVLQKEFSFALRRIDFQRHDQRGPD